MAQIEIQGYDVSSYPDNTSNVHLYLESGDTADIDNLDRFQARLLVNILRNEKPVFWNTEANILWTGPEAVGESEPVEGEEPYHPTPIAQKYASLGGQDGFLGKPIGGEHATADGEGAYRHYENGSIFWHPTTGAHEIHGAIQQKYDSWNWERSALGYPVTDELVSQDSIRFNRFQKGLIVWSQESGAQGICEDGINLDPKVDFELLDDTPYGNLKLFYYKMYTLHGIDLKYNVNNAGEKKYVGWQVADFRYGNYLLNGYELTEGERFVITAAQILLMQWHLRDLKNHEQERHGQISKYFKPERCFKQRQVLRKKGWRLKWVWKYNKWCSEFASYVYARAGIPTNLRGRQCFFCKNIGSYRKIDPCISNVGYYVKYFKNHNMYLGINVIRNNRLPLSTGNYFCRYDGSKPCSAKGVSGHSMLVLGFEENRSNFQQSKIFYINGNVGEGNPQNRLVTFNETKLSNNDLTGVGLKTASFE